MSLKPLSLAAFAFVALTGMAGAASAATMAECSTKYQTAKTAGTLNGMTWNDFRKSQCGSSTDTTAAATTTAPAAATTTVTTKKAKVSATTTAAAATDPGSEPTADNTTNAPEPTAPTMKAPKNVVFPRAVAALYANETPAKQRMHTCLDQYRTDKANNALGGLVWIQKGGGYYSICNAKLKG